MRLDFSGSGSEDISGNGSLMRDFKLPKLPLLPKIPRIPEIGSTFDLSGSGEISGDSSEDFSGSGSVSGSGSGLFSGFGDGSMW